MIEVACGICGATYSIPKEREFERNPCPECKGVRQAVAPKQSLIIGEGGRAIRLGNTVYTTPFEKALWEEAKKFFKEQRYNIAVIIAQTACEVRTERFIVKLIKNKSIPEFETFVDLLGMTYSISSNQNVQKLYVILTGDERMKKIKQEPFWEKLKESTSAINKFVHKGDDCTEGQARNAIEAFWEYNVFLAKHYNE